MLRQFTLATDSLFKKLYAFRCLIKMPCIYLYIALLDTILNIVLTLNQVKPIAVRLIIASLSLVLIKTTWASVLLQTFLAHTTIIWCFVVALIVFISRSIGHFICITRIFNLHTWCNGEWKKKIIMFAFRTSTLYLKFGFCLKKHQLTFGFIISCEIKMDSFLPLIIVSVKVKVLFIIFEWI